MRASEQSVGSQSDRTELLGQRRRALVLVLASALIAGCPSVESPSASRPEAAEKWYRRAQSEFQSADVDEARDSVSKALAIVPADPEVRLLAARIALSRLDYDETLRLLKGMRSSEVSGLRGRAFWYKGDLDAAADELDAMLDDPDVKDDWAKSITKLARRGTGRSPFALSGAMLAAVELPHVSPSDPLFVVPLEIDGESALAMISTGVAEVVLDSTTRAEPSWISIRFDKRFEIHDVPALTQDLSGVSKQLGAPIKAIIGINLLRHINATIDYDGHQFVVRNFTPPPPPDATRIELFYVRGGGMLLKTTFGGQNGTRASLLVDTSMGLPVVLDTAGWKKAGIDVASLQPVPQDPEKKLREGTIASLRLGAIDVPNVPGIFGPPITHIEKMLALDIDGVVGAGLLSNFRITFGDGGRLMWIEDGASLLRLLQRSGSSGAAEGLPVPPGLPGLAPDSPLGTPLLPPVGSQPLAPPTAPAPPKSPKPAGGARAPKAPARP